MARSSMVLKEVIMYFIAFYLGKGALHTVKNENNMSIKTFPSKCIANQYAKKHIISPFKIFKYL